MTRDGSGDRTAVPGADAGTARRGHAADGDRSWTGSGRILRARYAGGESPSVRVVEVLSALTGVEPIRLSPPFARVVDPDGLDAVLSGEGAGGPVRVSFRYHDFEVRVSSDGEILARDGDGDGDGDGGV
jgi:hypothetical protein